MAKKTRTDGDRRAQPERDAEEQVEAESGAEILREVGGHAGDDDGHAGDGGDGLRQVCAHVGGQRTTRHDAELRRQVLQEDQHQGAERDDPEQPVAELRAAGDVRGPVAGVDEPDGDDETGTQVAQQLAREEVAREPADGRGRRREAAGGDWRPSRRPGVLRSDRGRVVRRPRRPSPYFTRPSARTGHTASVLADRAPVTGGDEVTRSRLTAVSSSDDSGDAALAAALDLDTALGRASEALASSGCDVRRLEIAEPAPIDPGVALREALAAPVGSAPLAELARGAGSVAIVTSDATRAVPNRELLPPLLDELARGGVGSARVTVVFGGGAHRPVTADEAAWMLGPEWAHLRWVAHDARRSDCVSVGATPRGNDVLVNRVVADAGLVIALGVCEAHEFAGFSGGRKAILPAVAGYDSILRNHAVGLMSHPQARPGRARGQPHPRGDARRGAPRTAALHRQRDARRRTASGGTHRRRSRGGSRRPGREGRGGVGRRRRRARTWRPAAHPPPT